MNKLALRAAVRGAYDLQSVRIQIGNRLVENFKIKLGKVPGELEEEITELGEEATEEEKEKALEAKEIIRIIKQEFKKVTDGVIAYSHNIEFPHDGIISNYTELCLVALYIDLEKKELEHFRKLEYALEEFPIWNEFLSGVSGIGPAMGGIIISEFDIHKAKYVSSLWAYAGLDVASDGRGRGKYKEHLVDKTYISRTTKEEVKTKGITFNPFLKTKLVGVLASSFLRAGNEKYCKVYYDYKNRLANHAKYKDVSKAHRNRMAMRKMIKIFLIDLYTNWKRIEGLEIYDPYYIAKLGMQKHRENGDIVRDNLESATG